MHQDTLPFACGRYRLLGLRLGLCGGGGGGGVKVRAVEFRCWRICARVYTYIGPRRGGGG